MTTTRIREKISGLVSSQLPEFVSKDYELFVSFIEYYYKFLEQDQHAFEVIQNATDYSDIDKTTSSFINYFLKNYAKDLPISAVSNQKLLIKRINDLYASKGSDLSFKLLFQLLYGEIAKTSHPYDLVLKASDGIWEQKLSIQVSLTSGSASNLVGKILKVIKNGITYTDQILKVRFLETNKYELYIPYTSTTQYTIDDDVFVGTFPNYDFLGKVLPVTSQLSIVSAGVGFKVGQIYNVIEVGGSGTLIKVLKTHANTGVAAFKTINYGYGYESNTTFNFEISTLSGISAYNRNFTTTTGGFKDTIDVGTPHANTTPTRYFESDYVPSFALFGVDYVIDYYSYFEDIYVQDSSTVLGYTFDPLVSTTSTNIVTSATSSADSDAAVLTFTMGALARYPGEYRSSQGFVSEPDVRLADNQLYQPYAYQLESSIDISVFYDIVKKLVHPAGTKLFAKRNLENFANIRSNVSILTRSNVLLELKDSLDFDDVLAFTTRLYANSNIIISDLSILKSSFKLNDEQITLTDDHNYEMTKLLTEEASLSDSEVKNIGKLLNDNTEPIENLFVATYKTTDSNVTTSESAVISFSKLNTDSFNLSDSTNITFNVSIIDSVTFSDVTVLSTGKLLTSNVTPTDNLNYNASKLLSTDINTSEIIIKQVSFNLSSNNVSLSDSINLAFNASIIDSVTFADSTATSTGKLLNSNVTPVESTTARISLTYSDNISTVDTLSKSVSFALSNSISLSDNITTNFFTIPESVTAVESSIVLSSNIALTDAVALNNTAASSFITAINNNYSRTIITDSGTVDYLNYVINYFDYFVDVYVSEQTTF